MEISIAEASSMFPGFRFSPTDEELIQYYLKRKLQGCEEGVGVIPEIDICRYEPWDLPAHSVIQSDNEWFFFSPRGRKYPNGSQSRRATQSGYWKATGKERSVKSGSILIGTKRTLVFHMGRAPKGQRTEWIVHEYCTSEKSQDAMVVCRLRKNNEFHLNDNPRRISHNQMNLSAVNNDSIGGDQQSGMLEGAKMADSCSKELSNSYNSHSVEQVDTGSESDEKLSNEISQHHSSSLKKDYEEEEEDCYADIMKDDIIKLDDSSLDETFGLLPMSDIRPMSNMKSKEAAHDLIPFQGTANRRLRLRAQRLETSDAQPFDKENQSPIENVPKSNSQHATESLIDHFLITRIKLSSLLLFLVILILLVLFLLLVRASWRVDKLRHVFKFEGSSDIKWNRYLLSILW